VWYCQSKSGDATTLAFIRTEGYPSTAKLGPASSNKTRRCASALNRAARTAPAETAAYNYDVERCLGGNWISSGFLQRVPGFVIAAIIATVVPAARTFRLVTFARGIRSRCVSMIGEPDMSFPFEQPPNSACSKDAYVPTDIQIY